MMSINPAEATSRFPPGIPGRRVFERIRGTRCSGGSTEVPGRQVNWYLNRLRSMSGPEVLHRLGEQLKRSGSRRRSNSWADFDGELIALPQLPIAAANREQQQDLHGAWQQAFARAQSRSFEYFGVSWPENAGPDIWHLDPVSGKHWPSDIYCFHIPWRDNPEMGDVKYVWELNRLQFLQPVAALSALTNDPEPARFCLQVLDEWIESNPPFQGINWVSGIELALRTISILTVLSFIDPDLISREQRARLSACLKAHGYWLKRYPSRFSSANNHLIAEAAALFALGACWPELEEASQYASYGRQVLNDQVLKQICPDGVGAEQSPTYTSFTLEWYLLCLRIAEETDAPFAPPVLDQVRKAGRHLLWLMDCGGNVPRIGDDDEGRVFAFPQNADENYVSSVLASVAAFSNDTTLAPPVVRPHLRDLLVGRSNPNAEFTEGARTFDSGGYTIFRRTVRGKNVLLVLDHGPLGYLSIAAHGHADALSVWLHIDDQPVFVDAGTYLYHAGGAWRDYFRGTKAHNTVSIGETNSSTITGAFNWGRRAGCQVVDPLKQEEGTWSICVAHDGYQDEFWIRHQREVRFHQDGRIEISDRLIGNTQNLPPCHAGLLLHPDLTAIENRGVIDVCNAAGKIVSVSTPDKQTPVQIENGKSEEQPQYSGSFGSREPTSRLGIEVNRKTQNDAERSACMILRV